MTTYQALDELFLHLINHRFMSEQLYVLETAKPFAESMIWQLNRDYYQSAGVKAWQSGKVPHNLTSNSMVGKTYAELIFGILKDLAAKGAIEETVYILELGAGHGRLAFHTLRHLEALAAQVNLKLPAFCYILSDIAEDNLSFFLEHPQLAKYYEQGRLDCAYFDAIGDNQIKLRFSNQVIGQADLKQPLLVIANYFFDSIPTDLFRFDHGSIATCSVGLKTSIDPETSAPSELINSLKTDFFVRPVAKSVYVEPIFNQIIEAYRSLVFNTYLCFPHLGLRCLNNLRALSEEGIILISMDKGFHQVHDLEHAKPPVLITHGSFSLSVNYHAMGKFCEAHGGMAYFPQRSTFHLELACLLFVEDSDAYTETKAAYQRSVNEFGPDDYNGLKKFCYKNVGEMSLVEIIGILRLGAYDSSLFQNLMPRIKQLAKSVTFNERMRLAETIDETWRMYFAFIEPQDLAFEMAGILYGLGLYDSALIYFDHSIHLFGHTTDSYYNRILCFYQLRQDEFFVSKLKEANLFLRVFRI